MPTPTVSPHRTKHGAPLAFETVDRTAPLRVHDDETLLRMVAGTVRLRTGRVDRLLASGEEAVVPAGKPHRIAGVRGPARILTGVHASLR